MNTLLQDFRYAWRMLRKSPAFSAVIIVVLALGIAVNSAVFSIVDAVLLRKLPFRQPDRLVMLWEKNPTLGAAIGDRVPAALSNFLEWQRRATVFDGIAGLEDANLNLTSGTEPERVNGARASANFFDVLGVKPALGTGFAFAASDPGRNHVALLSDSFFHGHFGGETDVLGRHLTLNDVDYTIVGVLPPDFHLPASREGTDQRKPDLWIPYDGSERTNEVEFHRRKMQCYARLKAKTSVSQAAAEMDAIARQLAVEDPTQNAGFGANVFPVYVEDVGKSLRRNLFVLLASVASVLLIACANVANLMLGRALTRRREMAIRKALGATRWQLVRQMLMEGLLLAGSGGSLGLALARYSVKAIVALQPAGITRPEDIHVNLTVLIFTAGVSLSAAFIFAIVPALQAARSEVNAALHHVRGTPTFVSAGARKFLVVAEVALACVLLVGGGLMMKSLLAAMRVNPGFQPEHLLTMKFSMPASRYATNDRIAAFCQQVLETVASMPGVHSASFSDGLPLTRIRLTKFIVDGQPEPKRGSEPTADLRGIFNAGYFETVGIPMLEGRNFTDEELRTRAPVLVINRTLAHKLWPNESAIGRHLRSVPSKANPQPVISTVIGVVGDTHQISIEDAARPEVTRPMQDFTQLTLALRTNEPFEAMIPRIKNQVWLVDKYLPVYEVQTMEQIIASATSERRFESFLMSLFAALALLLAAVGIYGVLSSLVSQRTSEIGVRMALGAQTGDVLGMIVGEGLRLVSLGLLLGVGIGFAVSRSLSSLFFGVSAASPATYLEVSALMLAIAIAACYLPAARAARVDPINALRCE
jgi:predicted permease